MLSSSLKEELELLGIESNEITEGDEEGWQRSIVGLEYEIAAQDVGPELGLDAPLWIRGQVDRLEGWNRGDECFLRVVDYKTSSRATLRPTGKTVACWVRTCSCPSTNGWWSDPLDCR